MDDNLPDPMAEGIVNRFIERYGRMPQENAKDWAALEALVTPEEHEAMFARMVSEAVGAALLKRVEDGTLEIAGIGPDGVVYRPVKKLKP